ncbi:hypothetical protein ACLBX9_29170 [Methylobacterium sp. A49B]|uniref:Uncharacterized protein n=1 Tax=Methylobacterium mesophilicum SR1.6/6 TaxID=908290 RepID=A0A6B9FYQ6_9HYPH|nr:hypothetical protein [Methylobacterium mesophilicum]MBE7248567.1 hypothetical protein [Actinomycetospora chiangmaiensis]QGY05425.1 hypothetical protein MMSR116_28655 [Methylobacterium mesophilicum SR1.6/6]
MGSSDPELRMRQLAELRAAYDASSGLPDDHTGRGAAWHSKALLEHILLVLGGLRNDAGGSGTPGKAGPEA